MLCQAGEEEPLSNHYVKATQLSQDNKMLSPPWPGQQHREHLLGRTDQVLGAAWVSPPHHCLRNCYCPRSPLPGWAAQPGSAGHPALAVGLASPTWWWDFPRAEQLAEGQCWLEKLFPEEPFSLSKKEGRRPRERKMKCIWKEE